MSSSAPLPFATPTYVAVLDEAGDLRRPSPTFGRSMRSTCAAFPLPTAFLLPMVLLRPRRNRRQRPLPLLVAVVAVVAAAH